MGNLIKTLVQDAHIGVGYIDLIHLCRLQLLNQVTQSSLIIITINAFNNTRSHTNTIICNSCYILSQLHGRIVIKLPKGIGDVISKAILFGNKSSRFIW
ncbi:Uncharacterised protein [Streptococcus pneumoniae]|nr:Uncharacterised protein [Streptococcus pneumoniae]